MQSTATTQPRPSAPVLRGAPLIGAAFDVRRDYLATIMRAAEEVGDVARIDVGPPGWRTTFYTVSSPDAVLHVLGQPELYTKQTPAYQQVRSALGNGMLTSEGEVWHRQRRFLAPIFTRRRIEARYAAIMIEEAQRLIARWQTVAATGSTVDAHADMIEVTSRIIGRILFGNDMTTAIPRIMKVAFVNQALMMRGLVPHAMPMWIPTPANRRLAAGLVEIRSVVSDIVAARRAEGSGRPLDDMLGLLLEARDDENNGDRLSDQEVADQVLIFLLAGHETTATTLACGLVELAKSELWQQAVHDELARVLDGRLPTAADVGKLPVTGWVVREAMRMYPAAHSVGRRAERDDVLCGHLIPAGSAVIISPWAVHHSPKVWDQPEVFDPSRFDLPNGAYPGGHRHAWFPFGAGPHTCVGMQLALLEAPLVLATILQAFRIDTELTSIPLV
ncbi:MAG: cytochrome P450, partial [Nakamurella sp.]